MHLDVPVAGSGPAVSNPADASATVHVDSVRLDAVQVDALQVDAWTVGERRWDLYFAVVLLATVGIAQVAGPTGGPGRLAAAGALLAMVPWYLLVGRPALYGDRQLLWRGTIYVIGLVPLLVVAQVFAGSNTFILLALCPQCFMILPFRGALAAVVALSLTQPLVSLAQGAPAAEVESLAGIAAAGIAFSVAFGTWIIRIISQSAERAELIAQLERTRAELALANRQAGVLAERERLASEIHDTIAQGFTSIVMLAQAAESMIESDPAQARQQLELVGRTARENLAEARALVAGLAPTALTSGTLGDALARLTERAGQELGIAAEFAVTGEPRPLGTGAEVVLVRVCQEALSNVRKHAQARSVRVRLGFACSGVRLEVADDGVGFEVGRDDTGCFGLRGMRARVDDIGGKLDVTSALGKGTTVSAEVA
jgi:signal transduction histidine kinase